jgi:hypothetical protein
MANDPSHIFAVGQAVSYKSLAGLSPGTPVQFTIIQTLPPIDRIPQYRMRSWDEPFDRVAAQADLVAAGDEDTTDQALKRRLWALRFKPKTRRPLSPTP